MAATRKPKLLYLGNIWPKFFNGNINFIYLDDEESIFNGLKVIRMKLHVLVYLRKNKMSEMTRFVKEYTNTEISNAGHI